MKKLLLIALLFLASACSTQDPVDWNPFIQRSEALLQQAGLHEIQVQELGALDFALESFHSEFFGLAESDPVWINPETFSGFCAADAVGDASLLSDGVWEARECFLALHQSGNFYGPMPADDFLGISCISTAWGQGELLLLAEFLPAEDPIWSAFLHAAKVVWEQSAAFPDYSFCYSVWTAATYVLGDWQEQERFAAWVPSWQEGVRINLVLLHEGLLSSQQGKLPPGYGEESEIFRATAEQMLAFYEAVAWNELESRDAFEFGTALSATSKEAQWPAGVLTAEGILELRRLRCPPIPGQD